MIISRRSDRGRSRGRFVLAVAALTAAFTLSPQTARAEWLDLTNPAVLSSGFRGTGFNNLPGFFQHATQVGGVGVLNTFVEIGVGRPNQQVIQAYNTTVNNVLDNGSSDQQNHEIRVSDIPVVNIGGINYYQFILDINESVGGNPPDQYLSLDDLEVYTSTIPNQSTTNVSSLGTLRFDLGAGNNILLDVTDGAGSGQTDLIAYIPVWTPSNPNDFVYLYSRFGELGVLTNTGAGQPPTGNYGNSGGFEHWGLAPRPVPAPATAVLLGVGAACTGLVRLVRRQRPVAS